MDELLLLSGQDILIPNTQIILHPPSIKEIALIGEKEFFLGCGLLNMSKSNFLQSDISIEILDSITEFDLLYYLLTSGANDLQQGIGEYIQALYQIFDLLFSHYEYKIEDNKIKLFQDNKEIAFINADNFDIFKKTVSLMCSLTDDDKQNQGYNPGGEMSRDIAKKLEEAKEKLAKLKQGTNKDKVNILSKYSSVVAIALKQDLNIILNYTIFQLRDQYERYILKMTFDMNMKARLAGAKDIKDGKYWMDDVHENLHID